MAIKKDEQALEDEKLKESKAVGLLTDENKKLKKQLTDASDKLAASAKKVDSQETIITSKDAVIKSQDGKITDL